MDDPWQIFQCDSAVDLYSELQAPVTASLVEPADFPQRVGQEPLSPKPWIDAHHQDEVGQIEYVVERVHRRGWVDDDPRQGSVLADQAQAAI